MSEINESLWKRRRELPSANVPLSIVFIMITAALSAVTSMGFGGMFCIGVAGASFGFLLSVRRDLLVWITPLVSFGCAFAVSGSLYSALATLFYIPVGIVLAMALFTRRKLSFTVAVITVLLFIAMGVLFVIALASAYEGGIKECFNAFMDDTRASLNEAFSLISYKGQDGEVYHLSGKDVELLIESAVMIMPSVVVLTCQLLAYICTRIYRGLFRRLGFEALFFGHRFELTLSLPAAIVYFVSYALSSFAGSSSVLFYSAVNITYILMPAAAIAGFKSVFAKDGLFRVRVRPSSRIFFIVMCAVALFLSPLALIQFFAMFGSGLIMWRAFFSAMIEKKRKNGEDRDGQ